MADFVTAFLPVRRVLTLLLPAVLAGIIAGPVRAQSFEEALVDVGNTGLTVTNAGFVGNANIRNNPTGMPSFEYPLDSGVEHLFEAGLWVGARRADGLISVRTGAVTDPAGYAPGKSGYEFAQATPLFQRSTLPESDAFTPNAVSQQDVLATYVDTTLFVPGTLIPSPDPQSALGLSVEQRSYAWSFPFTEYFVIMEFEITNVSDEPLEDVWVGLWHDLVVRNVNTTTDTGSDFFNKGGYGFLGYPEYDAVQDTLVEAATDSQFVTYAFNAGGDEETLYTYGAIAFLGAEWDEPGTGMSRFFHPFLAEEYVADGYAPPVINPRWWRFAGTDPETGRPDNDAERYRRMRTPYPNLGLYEEQAAYEEALNSFFEDLEDQGETGNGNWIGMTPVGPFPVIAPGESTTVTFAFVGALKPESAAQTQNDDDARVNLRNNVFWAQQTYAGEDLNYNGRLDPGEDVNENGVLDRYLIPEPPTSPRVHVEAGSGRVDLYWDRSAEVSVDPISGQADFEGYRVYRSAPGDDRAGNVFGEATLVAQYDEAGNNTGFNNGFSEIRLNEPVTFPGDTTEYWYRFTSDDLLDGWQYAFAVTAIDEGDLEAGLPSFESSRNANAVRAFPGSRPTEEAAEDRAVGVYPNPYRRQAAWTNDGSKTQKLYFRHLPARAEIRVYTLAGEVVAQIDHDAATYAGDIGWFDTFSGSDRVFSGGEHAWDLLSDDGLQLAGGLYFFSVRDLDSGETQTGKFVIID
jgi:hypothetical protein